MSAWELTDEAIAALQPAAVAEHAGVLLGAGASVAAGLPNWDELAVKLLQAGDAIPDEETARAFMLRQEPTLVAEAAHAMSADWDRDLREALYGDREASPGVLHLATAALAALRPAGETSLLTLNFDELLEDATEAALEEVGAQRTVFARASMTPRASNHAQEIHHLHGIVPRGSRPTRGVILTLSDFNELGAIQRPWQASALQEVLSRGPLILAGTSYRDADMRQWLHDLEPAGNIIALIAREGLGLSRRQFRSVAEAIRHQWSAIGVLPVLVQDHSDAAQLIWEIPYMCSAGYLSPSARAVSLYRSLAARFNTLQIQHASELDDDRATLPVTTDDSDLTLWLSDGSDHLVRWASHDRTYRAAAKLRHVPVGYDSTWIAAQAAGRGEVLVGRVGGTEAARRWRTVIAAPVRVDIPGGPPLTVGALSAATTRSLDINEEISWRTALADLVEVWGDRLLVDLYASA